MKNTATPRRTATPRADHGAHATPSPTFTPGPTWTTTPAPSATPSPTPPPVAGAPTVGGCPALPADNIWNTRIDSLPVSSFSGSYIASMGSAGLHPDFGTVWNGAPNGIPFVVVPGTQPRSTRQLHLCRRERSGAIPHSHERAHRGRTQLDRRPPRPGVDNGACKLYELYSAYPQADGSWARRLRCACIALGSDALRPAGWTSADAAGLPILPGLVRYDEVAAGQHPPRAALHGRRHAESVRVAGAPLRIEQHEHLRAADGHARAAEGERRHFAASARPIR